MNATLALPRVSEQPQTATPVVESKFAPKQLYRLRVISWRKDELLREWTLGLHVDAAIARIQEKWPSANIKIRKVDEDDLIGLMLGAPS